MRYQASSRWDFEEDDDWGDRKRPVAHRGPKFEPKVTQGNPLYGKVRSYRGIPDGVDATLQKIATDIKVPVGEVVRAFLYSQVAYQSLFHDQAMFTSRLHDTLTETAE